MAVIIDDWLAVPELSRFGIHYSKVGVWNPEQNAFFQTIIAEHKLKVVRYKVSRWTPESESTTKKQGKSKKKGAASSRRARPNVLFNKYEIHTLS